MPSSTTQQDAATAAVAPPGRRRIYRHALLVRISHWINVICLTALLMSGLQIFNAHPALYWGDRSIFDHPWLAIGARAERRRRPRRRHHDLGHSFNTTGVLGVSKDADGEPTERAFPSWATLPGAGIWRWRGAGISSSPGSS